MKDGSPYVDLSHASQPDAGYSTSRDRDKHSQLPV